MTATVDVTDKNGMKHDDKGLFSGYSGSAHHQSGNSNHGPKSLAELEAIKFGKHGDLFAAEMPQMQKPKPPPPVFRIPNVKSDGPAKQPWRYADRQGKEHATRVDRITNQPVSQAMEDAINRLYRGEEIPMEDIEKIPEIRNEGDLAAAYCALDPFMHPEEYKDKGRKINDIYRMFSADTITPETNEALKDNESYQVKQGKELWLVTGLPGSGKSTTFVGPISKKNGARVVDSDAIKERMPGFCKGLGAPNVHEQSKSINDRILAESLKRGDNIVYPVLGYNPTYVGDQIDNFRRKGYKVHLILNELPFSQSLARCLERRLATGRNIPLAMFKKVGDRPSQAYEELKKKVDTFEKHSGNGIKSQCVERGENANLPPPKREEPVYSYHGLPLHGIETYEHDHHGNLHFSKPQTQPHVAQFAQEFQVKPQSKPKFWKHSWLDSFTKHGSKDAMDGADGADGEAAKGYEVDEFGNLILSSIAQNAPRAAQEASETATKVFDRIDLPDAFEGEIDGAETAKDLARFHYIAYDCE